MNLNPARLLLRSCSAYPKIFYIFGIFSLLFLFCFSLGPENVYVTYKTQPWSWLKWMGGKVWGHRGGGFASPALAALSLLRERAASPSYGAALPLSGPPEGRAQRAPGKPSPIRSDPSLHLFP
uniref:Uncharacterized protein n=1 Tax=Morchella brunnea TaxID=1174671 RepID=A0A8K1I7T5_9PEZI|nr:hypothetical protein LK370_mgp056 [Morchella brunnea]UBU98456.1 hypothetical protein [Morchella brunnea]